jgi:hypothetical protein
MAKAHFAFGKVSWKGQNISEIWLILKYIYKIWMAGIYLFTAGVYTDRLQANGNVNIIRRTAKI